MVALGGRGEGDELCNTSRAGCEVPSNPTKVVEGLVYALVEVHTGLAFWRDGILEAAKHVAGPRQGDCHGAQFTENGVPFLHAGALLGLWDAVKDLPQPVDSMWRQMDSHANGVHDPAEDKFDCVPAAVTLPELLQGDRFATEWGIICRQGTKDMINRVK